MKWILEIFHLKREIVWNAKYYSIFTGLHDQDANVNMAQDNNVSISDLSHSSIPKFTFEDIPRENITQEGNIS